MAGALRFRYVGIVKGAFGMMELVDLLFDPMGMNLWKWGLDVAPYGCNCNVLLL